MDIVWATDVTETGDMLDDEENKQDSPSEDTENIEEISEEALKEIIELAEEEELPTDGMYMLFLLGEKRFGIATAFVKEVIMEREIIPLPNTTDYFKGIINLRGTVISVIDLARKFTLPKEGEMDRHCIIILDLPEVSLGLLVDKVSSVITLPKEEIDQTVIEETSMENDYIEGIATINGSMTIFIDLDKMMENNHILAVEKPSLAICA